MTANEFRQMNRFPEDISRRKIRITKLEKEQAVNRKMIAGILRSHSTEQENSTEAANLNTEYDRRAALIHELKAANMREQKLYNEGHNLIETCPDPRTRAALSARYVEGLRYAEIVVEMEKHGIFVSEPALRQAVNRWIQKNF